MRNINKRKALASKVLGVGKDRIIFDNASLAEIKEAITKQDIRDLYDSGAITIREIKGRISHAKRTTRRGPGKIKMIVKNKKREYSILTRKFRGYIAELRKQGKINEERYLELRKMIKARAFRDKAHIKSHIGVK